MEFKRVCEKDFMFKVKSSKIYVALDFKDDSYQIPGRYFLEDEDTGIKINDVYRMEDRKNLEVWKFKYENFHLAKSCMWIDVLSLDEYQIKDNEKHAAVLDIYRVLIDKYNDIVRDKQCKSVIEYSNQLDSILHYECQEDYKRMLEYFINGGKTIGQNSVVIKEADPELMKKELEELKYFRPIIDFGRESIFNRRYIATVDLRNFGEETEPITYGGR